MDVGMTGTRQGMTEIQKVIFYCTLNELSCDTLHHGDCLGADAEAHDMALRACRWTHVHPPEKDELRAFKSGHFTSEPKGYFARNRDIVNESDVLIGTPCTGFETKGGTWYTINYGRTVGKPVIVIYPDGTVKKYNSEETNNG